MAFTPHHIRLRQSGKLAKTSYVNELTELVNAMAGPAMFGPEMGGARPYFAFIGKVAAVGPNGEADHADPRYWVKPQIIVSGNVEDALDLDDDEGLTVDTAVTVTNLPEIDVSGTGGTHDLPAGTIVYVFVVEDVGEASSDDNPDGIAPRPHYVMCAGGTSSRGQYEYQIYAMTAQNAPPSWILGPIAHPKIT
jgi:hypothetical protein